MRWEIRRVKGLSIAEQLAEQIRYAIATGQLKSGDQLPPGRVLAQELKVHFNTVFAVYRQLEREGLLVLKQGSGAYVAPISLDTLKQSTQAKLEQALSTLLELVKMGLVEPDELKRMIDERLQELQRTQAIPKVAFVECNLEQMETCCAQLAQTLGTEVKPILLDEIQKAPERMHPLFAHRDDLFPLSRSCFFGR
jgi:DNA-binding transcriptional regulator YhcF (GntR family)